MSLGRTEVEKVAKDLHTLTGMQFIVTKDNDILGEASENLNQFALFERICDKSGLDALYAPQLIHEIPNNELTSAVAKSIADEALKEPERITGLKIAKPLLEKVTGMTFEWDSKTHPKMLLTSVPVQTLSTPVLSDLEEKGIIDKGLFLEDYTSSIAIFQANTELLAAHAEKGGIVSHRLEEMRKRRAGKNEQNKDPSSTRGA